MLQNKDVRIIRMYDIYSVHCRDVHKSHREEAMC